MTDAELLAACIEALPGTWRSYPGQGSWRHIGTLLMSVQDLSPFLATRPFVAAIHRYHMLRLFEGNGDTPAEAISNVLKIARPEIRNWAQELEATSGP